MYPETALAIAVLETGGFRSRWMMKHHNWFGFRPSSRHNHVSTQRGYAVYATVDDLIRDYAEWEAETIQRYNLYTEALFRAWVTTHYATDPQYAAKLHQSLSQISQL